MDAKKNLGWFFYVMIFNIIIKKLTRPPPMMEISREPLDRSITALPSTVFNLLVILPNRGRNNPRNLIGITDIKDYLTLHRQKKSHAY